jgi:hypothetical protein
MKIQVISFSREMARVREISGFSLMREEFITIDIVLTKYKGAALLSNKNSQVNKI